MTCECVSPACEVHTDLHCDLEARRTIRSRDFGEQVLRMCRMCAIAAVAGGMFEVMHG